MWNTQASIVGKKIKNGMQASLMLFFVTQLSLALILQSSVLFVSDSVTRLPGINWLLSRFIYFFLWSCQGVMDALMAAWLLLAASLSLWDT